MIIENKKKNLKKKFKKKKNVKISVFLRGDEHEVDERRFETQHSSLPEDFFGCFLNYFFTFQCSIFLFLLEKI